MAEERRRQMTIDGVPVTVQERGAGPATALVLHGGGGPQTVEPIADHLAATMRVLMPTHPGWEQTPRPASVTGIGDLAGLYATLLAEQDVTGALVVGSSIGGWLAMELALRDTAGRVGALVLLDSMGIEVDGEPLTDFFALSPREIVDHSFHDADRFYVDPATVPAEQARRPADNVATMRVLAGDPYMHDPTLRGRLTSLTVPTEVIWGDSDGIATPGYGRALADAIPGARFELVERAGHLPQLERPEATFVLIDAVRAEPAT